MSRAHATSYAVPLASMIFMFISSSERSATVSPDMKAAHTTRSTHTACWNPWREDGAGADGGRERGA
jgi:hypothetical protein